MRYLKPVLICLLTLSLYGGCSSSAPAPAAVSAAPTGGGEEAKPRNSMMGDPPAEAP